MWKELQKPFGDEVEVRLHSRGERLQGSLQRAQGAFYLPWSAVVRRLVTVLPEGWSFEVDVVPLPITWEMETANVGTVKASQVVLVGKLTIAGDTREALGTINPFQQRVVYDQETRRRVTRWVFDPDAPVKAVGRLLVKCCQLFGIGLEVAGLALAPGVWDNQAGEWVEKPSLSDAKDEATPDAAQGAPPSAPSTPTPPAETIPTTEPPRPRQKLTWGELVRMVNLRCEAEARRPYSSGAELKATYERLGLNAGMGREEIIRRLVEAAEEQEVLIEL